MLKRTRARIFCGEDLVTSNIKCDHIKIVKFEINCTLSVNTSHSKRLARHRWLCHLMAITNWVKRFATITPLSWCLVNSIVFRLREAFWKHLLIRSAKKLARLCGLWNVIDYSASVAHNFHAIVDYLLCFNHMIYAKTKMHDRWR